MIITGDHYWLALKISRILLRKYKERLNKINVFPVPDGDTGNNLFLTIDGIWKKVGDKKMKHFGKFSELVAEAALESAVGNSGNILASFLYGIYDYAKDKEVLKPEELIYAFEKGTEYAYQSVDDPKEGTILTAMRVTVETAKKEIEKGNRNLTDILKKCVENALKELKEKRIYVPELVNYDVVDAGGLGFILIIKSWNKGISEEFIIELTKKKVEVKYSGRYCINVVLKLNRDILIEDLKDKLRKLGDSIIVKRITNKLVIHIHSKEKEKILEMLKGYGEIIKVSISKI